MTMTDALLPPVPFRPIASDASSDPRICDACSSDPSFPGPGGAVVGPSDDLTAPILQQNVTDARNLPDMRPRKVLTCTAGCRKRFLSEMGRTRHENIKHHRSHAPPGTSRLIKAEESNPFRCPVNGCKMRVSCQALLNIHLKSLHDGRMWASRAKYGPIKKEPEKYGRIKKEPETVPFP